MVQRRIRARDRVSALSGLRANLSTVRGRGKYNNQKVHIDGILFDSKLEADRYLELKMLEKAGHIDKLTIHPSWTFKLGDEYLGIRNKLGHKRKCKYTADFAYIDLRINGRRNYVVEDTKGMDTGESRLRRGLMELFHGIEVTVIRRR